MEKKSPENSPKPSANNSSDAEVLGNLFTSGMVKTENNFKAEGSGNSGDGKTDLKVPPLKIVIPQSSASEQDAGTSRNGKNSSQRSQLPYVVASSNSNDATDKDAPTGSPAEAPPTSKDADKKDTTSGAQGDEQVNLSFFNLVLKIRTKSV